MSQSPLWKGGVGAGEGLSVCWPGHRGLVGAPVRGVSGESLGGMRRELEFPVSKVSTSRGTRRVEGHPHICPGVSHG